MDDATPALTERQREIFEWVREFIAHHDYPPTQREIADAHDISSTRGVRDHLDALERKGKLKRIRNIARGIVLLEE